MENLADDFSDYRELLKGWYHAHCYVIQRADGEAYVRIPDVMTYDEDSGEFRHRRFLGFKGFGNQDQNISPAEYPVFASLQPPQSSRGHELAFDFEWCDEEWRNGQRLVEALCGPNWSDYALDCEEEVVTTDANELREWEPSLKYKLWRRPDFNIEYAYNGRIDSLTALRPVHDLIDSDETLRKGWGRMYLSDNEVKDYRLFVVGKPLVYRQRWTEIDAKFYKRREDGGVEALGMAGWAVSERGFCIKRDVDDLSKRWMLDPDDFSEAVRHSESKSISRGWEKKESDFLETCLYDMDEVYRERYGIVLSGCETLRSVVVERHPLARIPIAHYKNGRHVVQWKKAVDIRFEDVDDE